MSMSRAIGGGCARVPRAENRGAAGETEMTGNAEADIGDKKQGAKTGNKNGVRARGRTP
jgi:hypothetical protein